MSIKQDLEAIRLALFTGQKSHAKLEAQAAFGRIERIITSLDTLKGATAAIEKVEVK